MRQGPIKDNTMLPVGRLGIVPLASCASLGQKVNDWIVGWRKERTPAQAAPCGPDGYMRE